MCIDYVFIWISVILWNVLLNYRHKAICVVYYVFFFLDIHLVHLCFIGVFTSLNSCVSFWCVFAWCIAYCTRFNFIYSVSQSTIKGVFCPIWQSKLKKLIEAIKKKKVWRESPRAKWQSFVELAAKWASRPLKLIK